MKFIRGSLLAMMGSLLLLSPAFAQIKTSFPAEPRDKEPPKDWTRFTSHIDKFDVLMPAAPALKQETILIREQHLLLSFYGTNRGQSDYAVLSLAGLKDGDWHVAHMLMLDLYCRSSSSFKAILEKDISLNGYAGRQFRLDSEERVGEWRIYEVDKIFLAVAGSSSTRSAHSLQRFFDSFSLSRNNSTISIAKTAVGNSVSDGADRWLVILQTFSMNERARANRRMKQLRTHGYEAEVISTDSYSKLRPGLLILAMGPFSKRAADQRLRQLRSVAPQTYIKAGW